MYSINLTARADLQVCGLLFVCLFVCLWVKVGCGQNFKRVSCPSVLHSFSPTTQPSPPHGFYTGNSLRQSQGSDKWRVFGAFSNQSLGAVARVWPPGQLQNGEVRRLLPSTSLGVHSWACVNWQLALIAILPIAPASVYENGNLKHHFQHQSSASFLAPAVVFVNSTSLLAQDSRFCQPGITSGTRQFYKSTQL